MGGGSRPLIGISAGSGGEPGLPCALSQELPAQVGGGFWKPARIRMAIPGLGGPAELQQKAETPARSPESPNQSLLKYEQKGPQPLLPTAGLQRVWD